MKNTVPRGTILIVVVLALSVVLLTSCSKSTSTITKTAEGIVDSMAGGDFNSATKDFNAVMMSQLSGDKLSEVWTQLTTQIGQFKSRAGTRVAKEQGYDVVYVTSQFEKGIMDVKVVFDNNKQVTGLFVVPSQALPGNK